MSWRLKLAVFLLLISILGWLPVVVVPFLKLSAGLATTIIVGGIIFGQIAWNVGLIVGGVEALAKRQEIVRFFKKLFVRNPKTS